MSRRKDIDWIVMGGAIGETAHCKRCGAGLSLPLPMDMNVFLGASKGFTETHRNCHDVTVPFNTPPGVCLHPTNADEWIRSRDIGVSSATIWTAMTGRPSPFAGSNPGYDAPHDPADFGRCYRLLQIMPAWRKQLGAVARKWPIWSGFVADWDRLTALYERDLKSGTSDELNREIQRIRALPNTKEETPGVAT